MYLNGGLEEMGFPTFVSFSTLRNLVLWSGASWCEAGGEKEMARGQGVSFGEERKAGLDLCSCQGQCPKGGPGVPGWGRAAG